MIRHVYIVEVNGGDIMPFGTRARARAYVRSLRSPYRLDKSTAGHRAEFWDNPDDLDDQATIYQMRVH